MTEAIIVSLITGCITLVGVLISNSRNDAIQTERIDQLRKDISRLEQKQDKHNEIAERVYKCEENVALHEAELKRVNRRLEVVEKRGD